jgi:hypothetical protein
MCLLVTVQLFSFMKEFADIDTEYTDEEITKLEEAHETFREDCFLDDVFGIQSRLDSAVFLQALMKKAPYLFNSALMRKKVFQIAEVPYKGKVPTEN